MLKFGLDIWRLGSYLIKSTQERGGKCRIQAAAFVGIQCICSIFNLFIGIQLKSVGTLEGMRSRYHVVYWPLSFMDLIGVKIVIIVRLVNTSIQASMCCLTCLGCLCEYKSSLSSLQAHLGQSLISLRNLSCLHWNLNRMPFTS